METLCMLFGRCLSTVLVLRMAHRIWIETKQHSGTAGPGNMLGCCLITFYFLWVILSTSTVISLRYLPNSIQNSFISGVQFFVVTR